MYIFKAPEQISVQSLAPRAIWSSSVGKEFACSAGQLVKNLPAVQETPVQFLNWEDPLEKGWATHSSILGLPSWLSWQRTTCNARDLCLIPRLGRSPGEAKGYPLQYSGLENSNDCIVHGGHKESDKTERVSLSLS